MKWAEKRIQQYRDGRNPNILEKIALEHGHPVNFLAHLFCFSCFSIWFVDARMGLDHSSRSFGHCRAFVLPFAEIR